MPHVECGRSTHFLPGRFHVLRYTMKTSIAVAVLAMLAVAHVAHAVVPADEIASLPGWNGTLPSKQVCS